jgi:putative acetyltransferase
MEGHAAEHGASRMVMWSDTRFTKAHAHYRGLGYAAGVTRSLGDVSTTREFFFEKALGVREPDR